MRNKNGKEKSIVHLSDLVPDQKNANKGTQRGRGQLEQSLRRYGAGRSLVVDAEGNVIAGNKTVEAAAELELPLKVVKSDGNELVVVQRTDLNIDSPKGRGLAIADNRTSEVGLDWDVDTLTELSSEVDLTEFFFPNELEELVGDISNVKFEEYDDTVADDIPMCICPECGCKFPK